MKGILSITVLMCLAHSLSLAQQPERCKSPVLFFGGLKMGTQDEKVYADGGFAYDAINQRIHLGEMGTYEQQNFTYEVLMLYKEGVMYEIQRSNKTCVKKALKGDFQPFEVPEDAVFMSQAVLGTLAYPEQGLVVNSWIGKTPESDEYIVSFTDSGCLPVSGLFETKDLGWIRLNYFDNLPGMPVPDAFDPPPFCQQAKMEDGKKVDFFHSIIH